MTKKDNGKTATNPDLDSLLLNGSILLTAASRDELSDKATALTVTAKGVTIVCGPVGINDSGLFTQRFDIINH